VYSIIVFSKCFDVIRNYFTSIVQNEYVVKSEISRTIIGACIKIVLLWFKASLSLFIVAATFDTVLVSGGYIVSYQKKIGRLRAWKYDKSLVFFMLKEALPLVLSGMAVIIYQRIDQVMIKNMIDNQSVGHFATAGKFLDLTVFLPTIFTQTITPLLIRKRENDPAEYEIMKQKFVSIVVWTSVIIALMTSVSSYWLVLMTFGNEYLPAVTILQIMAWKTVGTALASSSGQIIIIERIHKWAFIRNLMEVSICIGLNLIFIPKWGIIGSAWVTIITMAFTGCLANIFIPPYYKIMAIQIRALLFGWKEVFSIKRVFA
jgi:O-antigen/teichoic acid export membrane protein